MHYPFQLSARLRSASWFSVIFFGIASVIFFADIPYFGLLRIYIAAGSFIYHLRFMACHNDPLWALNIQAVISFCAYGAFWGYIFKTAPQKTLKYLATIFLSLIFTMIFIISAMTLLPATRTFS